ncbi:hypothetical protein BJ741DRAFT_624744 [Chytriomyces cf. hyalinus JEL632]|nr:hypothetical protein BJ741DRAFT_624744 [Chytriomyces cf. hyalinus JEL632]
MHGIRRSIGLGRRVALGSTVSASIVKGMDSVRWTANVRASGSERDSIALATFLTGAPYSNVGIDGLRMDAPGSAEMEMDHLDVVHDIVYESDESGHMQPMNHQSQFHVHSLSRTLDPLAFLLSRPTAATDEIMDTIFKPNTAATSSFASSLATHMHPHFNETETMDLADHVTELAPRYLTAQTTRETIQAISIKKRRRKAMNKHKWKKLRRSVRNSVRYNKERRRKSGPMREKQE